MVKMKGQGRKALGIAVEAGEDRKREAAAEEGDHDQDEADDGDGADAEAAGRNGAARGEEAVVAGVEEVVEGHAEAVEAEGGDASDGHFGDESGGFVQRGGCGCWRAEEEDSPGVGHGGEGEGEAGELKECEETEHGGNRSMDNGWERHGTEPLEALSEGGAAGMGIYHG